MPADNHSDLASGILDGSRRALARLITLIENDPDAAAAPLATLYPHTGSAHLIGITGAPGTGKSTLVNKLALAYRQSGRTVGIIAVDPTSPFSGGAILGDRIRMRDLSGDPGIFIRSMATRGSLGGIATATADVAKVLDAAGYDIILLETVGAGQSEVEVARLAQSVVVVEAPGLGDDVQAIKAGILEIADILVVNKADDPRAKNTVRALRSMLDLSDTSPATAREMLHHGQMVDFASSSDHADRGELTASREIPIQQTTATSGEGITRLMELLDEHHTTMHNTGEVTRRERTRALTELENHLRDALLKRLLDTTNPDTISDLLDQITKRNLTARQAAERLLRKLPKES